MKNKLQLYVLGGCGTCGRIKNRLLEEELDHELIDCSSNKNENCDSLEDKVDCGRYPMAVIKSKGHTTVVYFCNKQSENTSLRKIAVDSEDKFIQEVKKAYI